MKVQSLTFLKNISTKSILIFLSAILLMACSKSNDPIPAYPKDVLVEYRITSASSLSKVTTLSYTNATGGTTTLSDANIPFSLKLSRTVNIGDDLGISVLHNNSANGNNVINLKLEILVDGKIVETETFEGSGSVSGAIVYLFL